jgi:hypothetical protein
MATLVGIFLFTVSILLWSRDPQAAVAVVFGPLFGLMAIIPAYLVGKGVEFVINAARREGLNLEDQSVTVGTAGIVCVLVLAAVAGAWMGWRAR